MFESIIIVLMGILFLIVLPIMSTIKYWNYKPYMKYALSLIWISYVVIFYEIFFPRDSYYINNLKNYSGIEFNKNVQITSSYTSFLNIKGEYYSCAIFEVSREDKKLLNTIKEQSNAVLVDNQNICGKNINQIFNKNNLVTFKTTDEKNYKQWGFLENSNKVFIYQKYFGMTNK
ncbi:MAG: hypothetical protein C0626_01830 [Arcobacter sp.]|uniref:hypothetical protein n=1 Tax=uncultured Arcobacter sp. TaxID=165434 RepID=UPI000CC63EC2|nr:hypothetical protein [uncultured Arcobacter sp.]PLY11333.1 MAG: hypothetical protein C0626_01830 [Arcobacter sp.]